MKNGPKIRTIVLIHKTRRVSLSCVQYSNCFAKTIMPNQLADVQLGSDVVKPNESTMSLRLRDIILQVDTTSKDSHPLSKRVRGMRKRDHPSVLAGDDLIRNWCEMQCTICTESFKSFTFKDVKKHYSQKHEVNGFLVCCRKKFFRRIRVLEHIARHINPREFRWMMSWFRSENWFITKWLILQLWDVQ